MNTTTTRAYWRLAGAHSHGAFHRRGIRGSFLGVFGRAAPLTRPTGMARGLRALSAQAKVFLTTGFETLPETKKIEEETLPGYNPQDYYPVRLGSVFESRYQVVGKLGYGMGSTVWLCRDLKYVQGNRAARYTSSDKWVDNHLR